MQDSLKNIQAMDSSSLPSPKFETNTQVAQQQEPSKENVSDNLSVFIPLATFILGLLVRELFSFLRERRQDRRVISESFISRMELNYLGESINKHRKKVEKKGGLDHGLGGKNKHTYMLAKSMQQAGANCLMNASALHFLLTNAPQLIRDWVLVAKHIAHIRESKLSDSESIHFLRRHGE